MCYANIYLIYLFQQLNDRINFLFNIMYSELNIAFTIRIGKHFSKLEFRQLSMIKSNLKNLYWEIYQENDTVNVTRSFLLKIKLN